VNPKTKAPIGTVEKPLLLETLIAPQSEPEHRGAVQDSLQRYPVYDPILRFETALEIEIPFSRGGSKLSLAIP
jgi:hypothetical protein